MNAQEKADAVSAGFKTVAQFVAASKSKPKPKAVRGKKAKAQQTAPKAKRKLSALGAAAKVLTKARRPMTCQELVEAMAAKKLWKSPGGKTPDRTLYAAITREISTKGKKSRFKKAGRGQFTLARKA